MLQNLMSPYSSLGKKTRGRFSKECDVIFKLQCEEEAKGLFEIADFIEENEFKIWSSG